MSRTRTGVLLMAHGTPARMEDVAPFYTRIRRGRPPPEGQLHELEDRYLAIGGTSPLAERTAAQVAGIEAALERRSPGSYAVHFGAKHTSPFIEDAAAALGTEIGVDRVVGLVLTPHHSSMGSGEYLERAARSLPSSVQFVPVRRWYDAPGFARLLAARVEHAMDALPAGPGRVMVLFTAHSLPERTRAAGDAYEEEVLASARDVIGALSPQRAPDAWQVAWQSAGRTPGPWIGPDVRDVVAELPARRFSGVVVCPIGFVADHLEVLYDIDVEAARSAHAAGLRFARTISLNDDPALSELLAGVIAGAAGSGPERA